MNKTFLQVWIMCPSNKHKMDFLLFQQVDQIEKITYWSPWELEIQNPTLQPDQILLLIKENLLFILIDPVVIPLTKSYEKHTSENSLSEVFLVCGIKVMSKDHLLIEHHIIEKVVKWIPMPDVLDFLHKEYHSVIFFDWYNLIKQNKLP